MKKYNEILNLMSGVLLILLAGFVYMLPIIAIDIPVNDIYYVINSKQIALPFIIYFIIIGMINIKQRKRLNYQYSLLSFVAVIIFGHGIMQHFWSLFSHIKRDYSFTTYDLPSMDLMVISCFCFIIVPQVILMMNLITTRKK